MKDTPTEKAWPEIEEGDERGCGNWGKIPADKKEFRTKIASYEACRDRCVGFEWCRTFFWGYEKNAGKCVLIGTPDCTASKSNQPYMYERLNRCTYTKPEATSKPKPEEPSKPTDAPKPTEETDAPAGACEEDREAGTFVAHGRCKGGSKLLCTMAESRYECMQMAKMDAECGDVYSYYANKSCFCQKKEGTNSDCAVREDRQYGIYRMDE